MTTANEAPVPDRTCAHCGHKVILKGEPNTSQYWQCEYNCRCVMVGCVPRDAKYGTA